MRVLAIVWVFFMFFIGVAKADEDPYVNVPYGAQEIMTQAGAWVQAVSQKEPRQNALRNNLITNMEQYAQNADPDEAELMRQWAVSVRETTDIASMKGFWEKASDLVVFYNERNS